MRPIHLIAALLMLTAALAGGYAAAPDPVAPDPEKEFIAPPGKAAAAAVESGPDADSDMIPQRLGILGAEVFLYDVSVGGVFEYRDDWSKAASRRAVISAALALTGMGYDPTVVPDAAVTQEMFGLKTIFELKTKMRYHCLAFRSRFYSDRSMYISAMNAASENAEIGAFYTSTLVDTVKYSIGSTDMLCNRYGVDGFVYVYGFQESRRFRQMQSKGAAASPASEPDRGRTYVAAILVGRDGRVLWYKDIAVTGAVDLRADRYSLGIVGALFE